MSDLATVLADNKDAVAEMVHTAEACESVWATPRATGKWSPSQVVEHVARALEESAHVVAGEPSRFPTLPAPVRPLVRGLFFRRVLKTGTFPKAKTNRPFDPIRGPETVADGRARLEAASATFIEACRARAAREDTFVSGIFGQLSVVDYARFQAVHTRHHTRQIAVQRNDSHPGLRPGE